MIVLVPSRAAFARSFSRAPQAAQSLALKVAAMTSAKTLRRSKPSRQVGIKDLAASLGISIGTVDRALQNRPGVNPVTRDRVLKMAEKLGYRPNVAARFLKLNRSLRIAVLLPAEIATFFQPLREGYVPGPPSGPMRVWRCILRMTPASVPAMLSCCKT